MGFGSYDESEQRDQSVETENDDAVDVKQNQHEGEVTFETDSADDLIDKFQSLKDDTADE